MLTSAVGVGKHFSWVDHSFYYMTLNELNTDWLKTASKVMRRLDVNLIKSHCIIFAEQTKTVSIVFWSIDENAQAVKRKLHMHDFSE